MSERASERESGSTLKHGAAFPPEELDKVLEKLTGLMEIFTKQTVARMGGLSVSGRGGGGAAASPGVGRLRPGTSGGAHARMALPKARVVSTHTIRSILA